MKIAIDLDATITMYPKVFSAFSKAFKAAGHEIHVVTDRVPGTESDIKRMLDELDIAYDIIHVAKDKASYILELGIEVLFDDTDQYFIELPENVAVMKVRGHYNFDYKEKKWMYSQSAGKV
ncbi:MAG: hypothetical protein LLF76_09650 [Planctomycetaceae bacterium]|nr:hypothetical protein [Planctomycetaceae bacterium]